jgi:serine/threonine protein kinase
MTSETGSVPEGPRFGPYILTAELGRGGMGVVYRAYDTVKARTVALKVLPPELAADPVYRERFRRESRHAARLSEPHIIPIHDYGQIDGRLFIDMRLVQGTDLSTMLERDGPLPPNGAAWIIAQVASALDAAHAEGLSHRDVKPSNVLITGQIQSMPFAYLIDFGIARAAGSVTVSTSRSAVGTLAYMAPERISGEPGDHRSDVYSLACVLYECLTGHVPYSGEMVAVMWAQVNAPPPVPTAIRPGLPAAVDQVIARGMAKDPDSRYGTAGELAAAMLAAADPGAQQAQPPEPAPAAVTYVPAKGNRSGGRHSGTDVPLWESDPAGRTQAALRAILANPKLGVAALSSSQAMSAALKDLLPGRPQETKVLVAAAEVGLSAALKYHTSRGMDVTTARRRAARSFAKHTGFGPDECSWAVDHLTAALGLDAGSGAAR